MSRCLPFTYSRSWHSRWVQLDNKCGLHRVASISVSYAKWVEEPYGVRGSTVCGLKGIVAMPGFLSRLAAKRCPQCCKRLGIPSGTGAPFNDKGLDKKAKNA